MKRLLFWVFTELQKCVIIESNSTIGRLTNVTLTDEELNRICSFMKSKYGVDLERKRTLIEGRLENKLSMLGFDSYNSFMSVVEGREQSDELDLLVNTLTTNHTYFMREPVHFNFMKEVALPQIKKCAQGNHDIRIWSAASSSGEEAYSIVMTLKDFFGYDASDWDTKVLATDISTKVLAKAKEGIFSAEQIQDLPTRWIKMYLGRLPDGKFQFREDIRNEIIFHTFNLMNPFTWKKKFHIIFLRNVMIYFDEPTKKTLIDKVCEYLEPGGYLFIGTTETIETAGTGLVHVQPSIYTKE